MTNYLERLSYDRETGLFKWAVSGRGIKKGRIAGSITADGYWQIKAGFSVYSAHRLAWFFVHGEWPNGEIDHINGDRKDNRIGNLRVVDRAGNSQNRRVAHVDNKSTGLLGATWNKQHKCYQAKIQANKVRHHLGYFDDPIEAHKAYMEAKARLHIQGDCH